MQWEEGPSTAQCAKCGTYMPPSIYPVPGIEPYITYVSEYETQIESRVAVHPKVRLTIRMKCRKCRHQGESVLIVKVPEKNLGSLLMCQERYCRSTAHMHLLSISGVTSRRDLPMDITLQCGSRHCLQIRTTTLVGHVVAPAKARPPRSRTGNRTVKADQE